MAVSSMSAAMTRARHEPRLSLDANEAKNRARCPLSNLHHRLAALAMLSVLGACAPRATSNVAPPLYSSDVALTVTNGNWLDVVVYVVRGTTRFRIGEAGGSSTSRLWIRRDLITDGTVQLMADPIGSNDVYVTEVMSITDRGDRVQLMVAPRMNMSSFAIWRR
jgi:hypothetical protein